ncbi:ATP-binding protein [Demequina sp. SYSU T00039]|uniref:histidine kinase n=1 Tax=Demequina lignilytica TaxID=3051663 RepID=A0AAW7M228_9MICO|nr:HAMP domain-containing histidine kinase [Demequina sp. SYSU T00039]MDN4487604.1 ATP-binding protein [Demequina sp. SYSU T00039]
MLQKVSIRWKLVAVVALPVLLLISTMGYIVFSNVQTYQTNANAQQLIETLGISRVVKEDLQTERRAGVNYAQTVQVASESLRSQTVETATLFGALAEAAGQAGSDAETAEEAQDQAERAAQVVADVTAALGGTPGEGMLDAQHALTITPPSAAGEWLGFPSEEEIQAQQDSYADVVAQLQAIGDSMADDLDFGLKLVYLTQSVEREAEIYLDLLQAPQAYQATLETTYVDVDNGLDAIAAAAAEVERTEDNAAALAGVEAGSQLRDSLPDLRAGIMAAQVTPQQAISYYSDIIAAFEQATAAIAIAAPDTDLVAAMQAFASIDAFIEDLQYEEIAFERMIRNGVFAGADAATSRNIVERTNIGLETAQQSALGVPGGAITVPEFGASVDLSVSSLSSFESIRNRITNGLDSSLVQAQSDDWPARVDEETAQYTPLRDDIFNRALDIASSSTTAARNTAILLTALAGVAIALTLIFAFFIARRIAVPLRRLTTTATAVRDELPRLVERVAMPGEQVDVSEVQIPVDSTDEVGRLAQAFNGVNAATLEIAREQAALRASISEMFVNVARRDQVLLNRQLSSIDEMERTEDDPNRLTKLFALDHLATRMRRNSESLLVLAGIDTGRRLRRAMPLSDVVRTASSEIELYERIDLDLVVDPSMHGHQALTAAHLFAELLENATVFSDPGSRVIIRTGRTAEGFTVEVIDTGIGMTAAELAEANSRVQSSAASEILGAQRLGLFVVGRIARRLGAQVAIASEEGKGTVATVLLPSELFEGAADEAPAADAVAPAGGYAPAAMVEGTQLSGRGADEPAAEAVPAEAAAPIPAPVDEDDSIPMPVGLDALIAADAAAAPEGVAVSGAELTEGTSASGLPSRRRRDDAAADKDGDERAVIGLPVRATAAQLSALEAESSAFTPTVPAAEVAPQTPEERAAMFRGFLPRREAEPGDQAEGVEQEALAVPGIEPDEAEEAAPEAPAATPSAAQLGGAFAAFDAIRRASADGHRAEAPAAAPEPVEPDPVAEVEPEVEPEPAGPALPSFAMPKLAVPIAPELEPEPEPAVEPEPGVAPVAEAAQPPVVESSSPLPTRRSLTNPSPEAAEPAAESPFARSPYGAPFAAAEPAPEVAPEPEPVQESAFAVPMLEPDEEQAFEAETVPSLEPDDAAPAEAAPVEDAPAAAPWLDAAAFGAAFGAAQAQTSPVEADAVEVEPEPVASVEPDVELEPEPQAFEAPPAPAPAAPGVESVALGEPIPAEVVPDQPSLDDLIAQASGEEAGRAGFFGRLFGRHRHDDAPAAPQVQRSAPFAPTSFEAPAEPEPAAAAPAFAPEPEPAPEPAPMSFTPAEGVAEAPVFEPRPAPAPAVEEEAPATASFTPEQLANPMGWEAAGQSAIAEADGDSGVYTPIIDTESPSGRSAADDEADLARDVFAELSSLSESRPKVEKTKAGLQKRRKPAEVEPEVTPLDEEVTLAHKERDAEAVRNRFSSFYSGTQRARSDAAELDLQAAPQHANE